MGVLGWSPDQFWQSTHKQLMAALDGWQEKNGGTRSDQSPLPISRAELNDLMRRYPDGSRS